MLNPKYAIASSLASEMSTVSDPNKFGAICSPILLIFNGF